MTVSATEDDAVRVRVADNGLGIPDKRKGHSFEEGEQGSDSDGTGLGLSLVNTVVERYNGEVWIEDNEPSESVFVVELPTASD